MSRRTRRFAGFAATLAFAFAQMAAAAIACQFAPPAEAQMAAHHEGCERPAENPNVCNHHCLYDQATHDAAKPLPALDALAGPVVAVIEAPLAVAVSGAAPAAFSPADGPPPPARLLPLRI